MIPVSLNMRARASIVSKDFVMGRKQTNSSTVKLPMTAEGMLLSVIHVTIL